MIIKGIIQKLKADPIDPIQYHLPLGKTDIHLNPWIGKNITLNFVGIIHCLGCHRHTTKSYQQGYCYVCARTLARCDICIVRPEKCHFHLGTCREPSWGITHCMIPHVLYVANTSGIKIGITRATQIPQRWIDQGAVQALPVLRLRTRHQAGFIEEKLKQHFNDKTDWRKMLRQLPPSLDLEASRVQVHALMQTILEDPEINHEIEVEFLNSEIETFNYPILKYPITTKAFNFEKTPVVSGKLLGIKGQYLLFEEGVMNVRNFGGFEVIFEGKTMDVSQPAAAAKPEVEQS